MAWQIVFRSFASIRLQNGANNTFISLNHLSGDTLQLALNDTIPIVRTLSLFFSCSLRDDGWRL